MKTWLILLVLVGGLCVSSAQDKIESEIAMAEEEEMNILGEDILDDDEEEEEQKLFEDSSEVLAVEEEEENPRVDPCKDLFCGAGRQCIINEEGEGDCVCVATCEDEVDPRRRVCSNLNETWPSDCELYRQRCLCEDEEPGCTKEEYSHMHIDFYGECRQFEDCKESELEDFPRRMSEWLFNIMRDMADRNTLSDHYLQLEKEAETDSTKQWTNAVIWKWCELDSHPRDRSVSRHELFPIRAPLIALEHCIGKFLDSCDPNDDHYISITEWAKCTNLSVDDVNKLENLCEDIRVD